MKDTKVNKVDGLTLLRSRSVVLRAGKLLTKGMNLKLQFVKHWALP